MHTSPQHLRDYHRRQKFQARVQRHEQGDNGCLSWLAIGLLWLGVALLAGTGGCKSGHGSKSIDLTGDLIGQIGALVETSITDAGPVGKANLPLALDKSKQAAASNVKANAEFAALDAKYTKLDGKWYVRWGRRIDAAVWTLAVIWGGGELLGAALMIFAGPAGIAIGHHILALLPFSNFFLTAAVRIKSRLAAAGGTGAPAAA